MRETSHQGDVIDYFHLLKDQARWWAVSKLWDAELGIAAVPWIMAGFSTSRRVTVYSHFRKTEGRSRNRLMRASLQPQLKSGMMVELILLSRINGDAPRA